MFLLDLDILFLYQSFIKFMFVTIYLTDVMQYTQKCQFCINIKIRNT